MPEIKKPQDHQETATSEPFIWTSPDGRKVTFTAFSRIASGVFRKAKSMNTIEATFTIIEAGTDEAGLEVIDDLPVGDLDQLLEDWSDASEVSVPQS